MAAFQLEYSEGQAQKEFRFEAPPVAIGRDKGADFVLDHPTVSRQHAVILRDGRGWILRVLSRGGLTALDGQQVDGEVPLFDGSVIHFGQFDFTFRAPDAAPRPSASVQSSPWTQQPLPPARPTNSGAWPQQPAQQPQPQPSSSGAWGQQPAQQPQPQPSSSGAWGQQPAQQPQPQPSSSGAWGQHTAPQPQPQPQPQPKPDHGLVSWDEIAQQAEGNEAGSAPGMTDYERIQAAAQKADKKVEKTNPLVVVVGLLLSAAMLIWSFYPQGGAEVAEVEVSASTKERYQWEGSDVDCLGESECVERARQAYRVGLENLDKKDVDVANLFTGWLHLARVDRYLEKAGAERSAAMEGLDQRRDAAREELNARFQNLRVKYHNASKRKMYDDMASAIVEIRAYFPDPRALEHQWSLQREREMREQGVFPSSYDRR